MFRIDINSFLKLMPLIKTIIHLIFMMQMIDRTGSRSNLHSKSQGNQSWDCRKGTCR